MSFRSWSVIASYSPPAWLMSSLCSPTNTSSISSQSPPCSNGPSRSSSNAWCSSAVMADYMEGEQGAARQINSSLESRTLSLRMSSALRSSNCFLPIVDLRVPFPNDTTWGWVHRTRLELEDVWRLCEGVIFRVVVSEIKQLV